LLWVGIVSSFFVNSFQFAELKAANLYNMEVFGGGAAADCFTNFFGGDNFLETSGYKPDRPKTKMAEPKSKKQRKGKKRTVQGRTSEVRCQAKTLLDALNPPRDVIKSAEAVRDKLRELGTAPSPLLTEIAEKRRGKVLAETLRLFQTEADAVVAYFNAHPAKRDTPDIQLVESGMVPRLRCAPAARQKLRELVACNRVFVALKISAETVNPTSLLVGFLIAA
jgi:hypothetical protein